MEKEETLNNIENELKGRIPEDCYSHFKRFSLCKLDHDDEILKTKGKAFYQNYSTEPFSRIDGCKKEFYAYTKCYNDFLDRYYDLKNYVAELEGKKHPFDLKEIDMIRNSSQYNLGLNKF